MFAHVANVPTIYIHNIQVESETVGLAASDNTRLPLAVRLRLGVFYEQLQSCGLSFYINKVKRLSCYKCIFILPRFNIYFMVFVGLGIFITLGGFITLMCIFSPF